MIKALFALYVFDTALTVHASANGLGLEINPLYWSFRYGIAEGLTIRIVIGLITFAWLRKNLAQRLLRAVTVGYAVLIAAMAAAVYGLG